MVVEANFLVEKDVCVPLFPIDKVFCKHMLLQLKICIMLLGLLDVVSLARQFLVVLFLLEIIVSDGCLLINFN